MAVDNKLLGQFNLDGIPPAPRGMPQIEVTFDIDANGILTVTAKDKASNRSQHITITASSGLTSVEVDKMRKDAEAHADEDLKRKELIEARNHADNTVYAAEKSLREYGDKVPAEVKSQVEAAVTKVKEAMQGSDAAAIRQLTEELGQVLQKIGGAMYEQQGPQTGGPGPSEGQGGGTSGPGGSGSSGGDDVVEGEFKEQ